MQLMEHRSWKHCIAIAVVFFLVFTAIDHKHIILYLLVSLAILLFARIFPTLDKIYDDDLDRKKVDNDQLNRFKQSHDEIPIDRFDDMDKIEINDKPLDK